MQEIYNWLLQELYIEKHVHKVLRDYRKRGFVSFSGYEGRFAFDKKPLVSFPPTRLAGS